MSTKPISTIWEGSSWQLVTRDIQLPNGETRPKAYIQHPGAVVLVPMIEDQIILLWQYRVALDGHVLELPAGTRLPQESWQTCAQRELREETGFRAGQLTSLGEFWPGPGITCERMALFLARELTPDPLPSDDDEQFEQRRYPMAELVDMALSGQLEDAKSIVGVLRVAHHLNRLAA